MIDYDKLNEHLLEMAKNADGGIKLSTFMIDQLLGGSQKISEKSLHDGVEFAIAKQKKEIESMPFVSREQKDTEKNRREIILKLCEEQMKTFLKSQNKLL
jgi:hypothetical protein